MRNNRDTLSKNIHVFVFCSFPSSFSSLFWHLLSLFPLFFYLFDFFVFFCSFFFSFHPTSTTPDTGANDFTHISTYGPRVWLSEFENRIRASIDKSIPFLGIIFSFLIFFQPVHLSTRNPDLSPSRSHESVALDCAVVVVLVLTAESNDIRYLYMIIILY